MWVDYKYMFGGKVIKKEVFEKIVKYFIKVLGCFVSGEQCMRKWGKIILKQKEIEDYNKKSGNDKRSWKFYEEFIECLVKDVIVIFVFMMESNVQLDDYNLVSCNSEY